MRVLAVLLLLAVLPTVEVSEQVAHFLEHALAAEVADHSAHHEGTEGDEHGCTGLIHLCSCHQTQVTITITLIASRTIISTDTPRISAPRSLVGLRSPEPAQRPPIS